MFGVLCTAGFLGSVVFSTFFTDTYEDLDEVGLNFWYILSMLIGTFFGAYGLVGLSIWLLVMFPLVEMAWLSLSFGLYCLGCLMGLFK